MREDRARFPQIGHRTLKPASTAVIERLKMNKLALAAEMNKSKGQAIKATETQGNGRRRNLAVQAANMDKKLFRQEVQNLTGVVDCLSNTTSKTVDEFLYRLKLDLNLVTDG